jgi:hypothetical protein
MPLHLASNRSAHADGLAGGKRQKGQKKSGAGRTAPRRATDGPKAVPCPWVWGQTGRNTGKCRSRLLKGCSWLLQSRTLLHKWQWQERCPCANDGTQIDQVFFLGSKAHQPALGIYH